MTDHYQGFASSLPSAILNPGDFGQNILLSTPFDQITQFYINTTDAGGTNHAAQLGDASYIVGRYLTIISNDISIPGRAGVYGWIRIDGICEPLLLLPKRTSSVPRYPRDWCQ